MPTGRENKNNKYIITRLTEDIQALKNNNNKNKKSSIYHVFFQY